MAMVDDYCYEKPYAYGEVYNMISETAYHETQH